MKFEITLIALLFSVTAFAGGYYNPSIDVYDPVTGLYYKSIRSNESHGFLGSKDKSLVNVYIYDPVSDTGKFLFPQSKNVQILSLAYETSVEDGKVSFYATNYSSFIKNNQNIEPREPKSRMLILTRNTETDEKTIYFAKKDGSDLQKLRTLSQSEEWHIGVKNSVIRIVKQVGLKLKLESINW
ncbi:MAG: hypothetical protein SVC26_09385 [Pseudomonadota bacterium]|nr:hypothetical protein [Pseudomonadota bacterium]